MSGWEALAAGNTNAPTPKPVPKPAPKSAPDVEEIVQELRELAENRGAAPEAEAPVAPEPVTSTEFVSRFPGLAAEMEAQSSAPEIKPSHIFMGIVGHEGTGKTGLAFDAHAHKYPDGLCFVLDHDNGGLSCKLAHYDNSPMFRVFEPWVMQQENRTAYNYLASYNRVMDIAKFAVEYAQNQQQPGFEGPLLRSFIVTGLDQFDGMCINVMKIHDLDMDATDAVAASAAKLNKEIGWNWSIRATRFKQLTAQCQKLNRLGVDVYWETHLKEDKEGKVGFDGWKFAWHGSANQDLFQVLWCKRKVVRNAEGARTGETRYSAEFFKQKTNSNLLNQQRDYFVTNTGEEAQWYGMAELRDGAV
tara:strand:- start:7422 stop:8501 length:1080 start_codon:yes stop_codon:yes gene_type:complete